MANGSDASAPAKTSLWKSDEKPWWAPDAQGFTIAVILLIVAIALFYRMTHPSDVNDKMLETMLTIMFSTALVAIINYLFGSSRGSSAKDDTQNKVIEKLTSTTPPGPTGPVAPLPAPVVVVAWWSKLTDAERAAVTAAAPTDPAAASFMAAAQTGQATAADLDDLVSKGILTQARADAIEA